MPRKTAGLTTAESFEVRDSKVKKKKKKKITKNQLVQIQVGYAERWLLNKTER